MKILEKYKGTKTYMFPNGAIATPEVIEQQFPAVTTFTHIIETDVIGEVCFAVQNLAAMRSVHELDMTLTEDEAIAELQRIINLPSPEPVVDDTQQRMADALQDLVVLNMPDAI